MTIRLRYFASIREAVGLGSETLDPGPATTVGQVRDQLIARGGAWAQSLARTRPVRAALNQSLCAEDAVFDDDAEIAFFPPVTGG